MTDIELLRLVQAQRPILQIDDEILWALERIRSYFGENKLRNFLELGCHTGSSLCMWSQLLAEDGLLIGVTPIDKTERVAGFKRYVGDFSGKRFHFVNGLSENPASLEAVKYALNGEPLDGIFIDTIHTAKQSRKEWMMYSPLLGKKAVACFHDIVTDLVVDGGPGTGDFWHLLKRGHKYEEKHSSPHDMNFGIGILFL